MAARNNAAKADDGLPADLRSKRSALAAVQAEVAAEEPEGDATVVTLRTRLGFHDMRVPPYDDWTAVARNAMNRDDGLTWAQYTLPQADAMKWMQLNPTVRDEREFFEDWARKLGQSRGE